MSSRSRALLRAVAAHASTASASPGSPGWTSGSGHSRPAGPAAWAIRWARARVCSSPALTWFSAARRRSARRSSTAAKRRVSKSLAEQLAAGFRVGPQETGEVALRQEHHLAELFPAHPDELRDLLTDLLVRTAQRLPALLGVVHAQPALRLLDGVAAAPLLGPGLGRAPGDLQTAPGNGEFEPDLGRQVRGGVVAAQRGAGALPGAGHGPVQGVADGVEDRGLAGCRSVRAAERARPPRARRSRSPEWCRRGRRR